MNFQVVLGGQVSTKGHSNTFPSFIFTMTLQHNRIKENPVLT